MRIIDVGTKHGDVEIREDELHTLPVSELRRLGISRKDLMSCFADGVELMRGRKASERVRPVAEQLRDGTWGVVIVGYSELTDPLLNDGTAAPPKGKRNYRKRTLPGMPWFIFRGRDGGLPPAVKGPPRRASGVISILGSLHHPEVILPNVGKNSQPIDIKGFYSNPLR